MKAIKYLIVGLLVVSVTKKAYMIDTDQRMPFAFALSPKDAQVAINALGNPDLQSMTGLYDPVTKTATIVFTNVMEYKKSVTPPNVMNRKLKLFGTMQTPGVTSAPGSLMLRGGVRPITSLYGIPQAPSDLASNTDSSDTNNDKSVDTYDAASKTAMLKNGQTYVGVIEYSRAVTPPNISNPALQQFASIATPNYTATPQRIAGGLTERTLLFGLPVSGEKLTIKSSKDLHIGFYWPDNKIVQLNNGETFVCIIQEKKRNYKQANAIGPVFTWFDQQDLKQFGILNTSSDFKSRVENIGTVKLAHSNTTLYGVLMNPREITLQQESVSRPRINQPTPRQDFSSREKAHSIIDPMTSYLGATANFVRSRRIGK